MLFPTILESSVTAPKAPFSIASCTNLLPSNVVPLRAKYIEPETLFLVSVETLNPHFSSSACIFFNLFLLRWFEPSYLLTCPPPTRFRGGAFKPNLKKPPTWKISFKGGGQSRFLQLFQERGRDGLCCEDQFLSRGADLF